jgi:hypothetical protein
MPTFIFTCPRTGFNVQHSFDDGDEDARDTEYEAVTCPACARLHFVNLKTRKLLGQDAE